MLHYLDDLDSKMESMRAHLYREAGLEGTWTGYNPSLGRPLLKREKFLAKDPGEATPTAVEPASVAPASNGALGLSGVESGGNGTAKAAVASTGSEVEPAK